MMPVTFSSFTRREAMTDGCFENVRPGDAGATHVDHIGLREHGADRTDLFPASAPIGQRPDFLDRGRRGSRAMFYQELAGAPRRTGWFILVRQHLAALVDIDRAAVERAEVHHAARAAD